MTALLCGRRCGRVQRVVPKTRFYEHTSLDQRSRTDSSRTFFRRITWAYSFAESTINLPGGAEVPEIQVFKYSQGRRGCGERPHGDR